MRFLGVFVIVLLNGLTRGDSARVSELDICPVVSITDAFAFLGFQDSFCDVNHSRKFAVIEGDEGSLQKALYLVNSLKHDYVAVLFYASWCPFSREFRPFFSIFSTLYPSIPHFAIAESAVKPSILSKYGVHGFPTLILLNSTMRVHNRGPRDLNSLVFFYTDVSGIELTKRDLRNQLTFDKLESALNPQETGNSEPENCPFTWARSPENMLREETYLALATTFVLLRLMYFLFPYLFEFGRFTWRRSMEHVRITALWDYPLRYLNKKTKQFLSSFRDPRKGSNFPGGAISARAWASKSLASAVSIGDASTSRVPTLNSSL